MTSDYLTASKKPHSGRKNTTNNILLQPRPSYRFCDEKFSCETDDTLANCYCDYCETFLCQACFYSRHQTKPHCVRQISTIPIEYLCEGQLCKNNLPQPNFADYICFTCGLQRFCATCNDSFHRGIRSRDHNFVDFANYFKEKEHQKSESKPATTFVDCEDSEEQFHSFYQTKSTHLNQVSLLQSFIDTSGDHSNFDNNHRHLLQSFLFDPEPSVDKNILTSDSNSRFQSFSTDDSITSIMSQNLQPAPIPRSRARQQSPSPTTIAINGVLKSVHLIDENETLLVKNGEELCEMLHVSPESEFRVVSIFGNTGDGKSYTMNHTFFNGEKIFKESPDPQPCTLGVWAAVCNDPPLLVLDTEGLLGSTDTANQRTRMLLKVLAVSDVVIYRSKGERLHTDMFQFLKDAQTSCQDYMLPALREALKHRQQNEKNGLSTTMTTASVNAAGATLGPGVVVFHEPNNVRPLEQEEWRQMTDKALLESTTTSNKSKSSKNHKSVFSAMEYFSSRPKEQVKQANFVDLKSFIKGMLDRQNLRHARTLSVFIDYFTQLHQRFSGKIEENTRLTFPDQYFTCQMFCEVCHTRCILSMNHADSHKAKEPYKCVRKEAFDNKIFFCQQCKANNERNRVIWMPAHKDSSVMSAALSYLWKGSVLWCDKCGVLMHSREEWFSPANPEPVEKVDVVYDHIFPGDRGGRQDTCHPLQRIVDNVKGLSEPVGVMVTNITIPDYWEPNDKIKECCVCQQSFAETGRRIHHCRRCGKGVCDPCSPDRIPVEDRGFYDRVRVCNNCKTVTELPNGSETNVATSGTGVRKAMEATAGTFGVFGKLFQIPAGLAKDYARPNYWQPDAECIECYCCQKSFIQSELSVHHCRACGYGVCDLCSPYRETVPSRGYYTKVRVCKKCCKSAVNANSIDS